MGDLGGRSTEYIPNTPYKFSPEEYRVLQRCNRESFYQRSLPISTILGLGTYWCCKSGYFKSHPRYGASFKVTGAVILGYFIGKISYQKKCAEYFMQLPNSEIGEMLRKKRNQRSGMMSPESPGDGGFYSGGGGGGTPGLGSVPSKDVFSDMPDSQPYLDIDTDRPHNEGLSDAYRPSVDYPALEDDSTLLPAPPHGGTVTYEDLRRKNREDYLNRNTRIYRNLPTSDEIPTSVSPNPTPPQSSEPAQDTTAPPPVRSYSRQKNMYGDVWEK